MLYDGGIICTLARPVDSVDYVVGSRKARNSFCFMLVFLFFMATFHFYLPARLVPDAWHHTIADLPPAAFWTTALAVVTGAFPALPLGVLAFISPSFLSRMFWWSSGNPRILLVLVREFESRRGGALKLLAKIKTDQLLRAPGVGIHYSTRVDEGRKS